MSRRVLSIDLETYSDVDLPNCGVYRYVEGDFHILLFAYAFDDEETKCVDMACGEQLPTEVVDALQDDSMSSSRGIWHGVTRSRPPRSHMLSVTVRSSPSMKRSQQCRRTVMPVNDVKCVLFHDNFQNFKSYCIPKAQLVIADIPYNIGGDFYASRPDWYVDGDNQNGESSKAHKAAFHTDYTFNIAEYFAFCNRLLKKEPSKGEKDAPCMIVFCAFQQIPEVIRQAEKYGFKKYQFLCFMKNYSPQVLKANMRIVGATEYALVLYRGKLPKFRNTDADGKHRMIFNHFEWVRDGKDIPKIHPSQKPVNLLKRLIGIFTDEGDVVIDPCAGSGSTLRAARELRRHSYGFEVSRDFYTKACEQMLGEDADDKA